MFVVRRSTGTARAAPNTSAPWAVRCRPFAAASPMAMRHAISSAVMPTRIAPPTTSDSMPGRVVRKNVAISVSATTAVPARAIAHRSSSTVTGVSSANETSL